MYQATTPTHTFTLPFDTSLISKLLLTYSQDARAVITKTENDVSMSSNIISLTLTQEETSRFAIRPVSIQMRCKVGDKVMASDIVTVRVKRSLNREVI